tara:strand:+ start:79 stop:228 length:150 start_codon:yes stop_codon:yes gene_type:complete
MKPCGLAIFPTDFPTDVFRLAGTACLTSLLNVGEFQLEGSYEMTGSATP